MGILQNDLSGDVPVTDNPITEILRTREARARLASPRRYCDRVYSHGISYGMFWGEHSQARPRGSPNTTLWKLEKTSFVETREIPSYIALASDPIILSQVLIKVKQLNNE